MENDHNKSPSILAPSGQFELLPVHHSPTTGNIFKPGDIRGLQVEVASAIYCGPAATGSHDQTAVFSMLPGESTTNRAKACGLDAHLLCCFSTDFATIHF